MSLNITPAQNQPHPEGGSRPAAKYVPSKPLGSVAASHAPIPGADQPVQIRGLPQTSNPGGVAMPQRQPAAEGGVASPPEALTPEELARRTEWWSQRLGLLSRRDKESREMLAEAKSEMAKVQAEREHVGAQLAQIEEWNKANLDRRTNPARALADAGWTLEGALQYGLQDGKLTPEQQLAVSMDKKFAEHEEALQARIRELTEQIGQRDKERTENEEKRLAAEAEMNRQAGIEGFQGEIADVIKADAKTYPLLALRPENASVAVYDMVEKMFDDYNQKNPERPLRHVPTQMIEEACAFVEQKSREEYVEFEKVMQGLSVQPPAAAAPLTRLPSTLHSGLRVGQMTGAPTEGQTRPETQREKEHRVKAMLDELRARQRAAGSW